MLPKTMPLPGGRGWRMSPVRATEWSPCPFTSTLRPMVRSGKRRAGARDGAGPAAAGAAVEASAAFVPSARPTTRRRAWSGNGFSRKSKAPRRMTRTAVSIVPCPEMTMIGPPGAWLRMRSTSSMPSISGIHTSTIASRGATCWSSSRARRPSGASSTSNPSSASTPRRVCRIFSSSSTTRIVSDIPHLHPDVRRRRTLRAARAPRVEQRALDPLAVQLELGQLGRGIEREGDLAMALAEEDERLLDQTVQVLRRVRGRGQAREGRELVHQGLQLVDLLDDGARALVEHGALGAEAGGVAAAEPLCRELDRRERVLDLVRDATRDLSPRLHALHAQGMAHLLEEEDHAPPAPLLRPEARAR